MRERLHLALPARVSVREGHNSEWTAITQLIDVTPFGARFNLARPIDIGRLLQLTTMMPRKLRAFDHVEEQYRVWAIVRNVTLLEQKTPKDSLVTVGVAFIGKRPPRSYEEDPAKRYEIAQAKLESQQWSVREDSVEQLTELKIEDKRQETRQMIPVDVVIQVFEEDKLARSEPSVTENISRKGAVVFTTMEAKPGTFLKVTSDSYHVSVLAVVRARRTGTDGITRLHLEFLGSEWPL